MGLIKIYTLWIHEENRFGYGDWISYYENTKMRQEIIKMRDEYLE